VCPSTPHEYTLATGRADTIHKRLVIEYKGAPTAASIGDQAGLWTRSVPEGIPLQGREKKKVWERTGDSQWME
jgi:hypothetical protein